MAKVARLGDVVLYRTDRGDDRAAIVVHADEPTADGPRRACLFVFVNGNDEADGVSYGLLTSIYEGGGRNQWRQRHVAADNEGGE